MDGKTAEREAVKMASKKSVAEVERGRNVIQIRSDSKGLVEVVKRGRKHGTTENQIKTILCEAERKGGDRAEMGKGTRRK